MKTNNARKITLTLMNVDVLQILDALDNRAEAWENTEALLLGEIESQEFFVPEDCDDPLEAAKIAQHFRDVISEIEAQLSSNN